MTLAPMKEIGYQVVFDIKQDILLTKKLVKKYVGGIYENDISSKRYKVEIKGDRALLHKLK